MKGASVNFVSPTPLVIAIKAPLTRLALGDKIL